MPKTKFPKEIFVAHREDSGSAYLLADDDHVGFDDGESVAVNELSEVRKKTITHELSHALVPRKGKRK